MPIILVCSLLFYGCNSTSPERRAEVENAREGIMPGNMAPDMGYPNPEGEIIKLSSLEGKMVLIDFWASWCQPCRKVNPELVAVYKEYKDRKFKHGKGFTIYSVSCDRTHEEWVHAIAADSLVWENHVSDLKGWEAEATYTYQVSYIPYNLLIDGDRLIVARELHTDALRATLDSLLVK